MILAQIHSLGTMIPIPKDKKKSLCNSSNYMAIALSRILTKILDWIILLKENIRCVPRNFNLSVNKGLSTTQCTL